VEGKGTKKMRSRPALRYSLDILLQENSQNRGLKITVKWPQAALEPGFFAILHNLIRVDEIRRQARNK
jgi:hypothetical protein